MRTARYTAASLAICLIPLVTSGCGGGGGGREIGPTGEVEGSVTVDGEPLTQGSVSLYDPSTGNSGGGDLGPDGKFKFTAPVPVGKYDVSFLLPEAPPPDDPEADKLANESNLIHELYRSGDTSRMSAEVKEGLNRYTFDLKKNGPRS